MKQISNKNIDKLLNRAKKELTIKEVTVNNEYFEDTINYLKKQNVLSYKNLKKIFDSNNNTQYPLGYIILNRENNIVGFMGTFFSEKLSKTNKQIFCNIHSWIVDLKYRINSFYLLSPVIKKNFNLTAFTPVPTLVGLLVKFGFIEKFLFYRVVFCLPYLSFFKLDNNLIEEKNIIKTFLKSPDLEIFNSYVKKPYIKILIKNNKNNKYIFIIGVIIKKKRIKIFNIFYVSNTNELKNEWKEIKVLISKKLNIFFFSEYIVENHESIFPKNVFFSKKSKKNIYVKTEVAISQKELLNSDLIVS